MILNSAHVNMQFELDQSNCNETLTILIYTADIMQCRLHITAHVHALCTSSLHAAEQFIAAGEFTAVNHIARDILYIWKKHNN